jgi:uncharacterized protein (DUF1800 family)/uncharacterized protein (DUF1501 family)
MKFLHKALSLQLLQLLCSTKVSTSSFLRGENETFGSNLDNKQTRYSRKLQYGPFHFSCPEVGVDGTPVSLVIETSSILEASASGISVDSTLMLGDLCILTIQGSESTSKPVARSYDAADWEISAGPFTQSLTSPICSGSVCTFVDLPIPDSADETYVLTSYHHNGFGTEAEAARFLEQATFGPTRATIDSLVASGQDKYMTWVKDQIETVPMSSHREYYRRRVNPRFEYPFVHGAPGPKTACDRLSHWRTFALSERDGLRSTQSKKTKYLDIKQKNGRYVWYVEGMPRTTTDYLPDLLTEKGDFKEKFELYPVLYAIHFRDNERFSCIECPVQVYKKPGGVPGYVNNPKVDLTGIVNDPALVPYTIIDLPPILGNDNAMVTIDNGEDYTTNVYFSKYSKPNDEFWLNDATSINPNQCLSHPSVLTAAYDTPTKLSTGGNEEVSSKNHPETAFPPLFGKTLNTVTGQYEHLLFDPHLVLFENSVENPLPDGGGRLQVETKGYATCANAPRTFINEDHCKLSFSEYACTSLNYNGIPNPDQEGVVVCGSVGEVANEFTYGTYGGFDFKITEGGKLDNKNIYLGGEFMEYKNTVWANHALYDEGQLRQRMAWALYQIIPIGKPMSDDASVEVWLHYYDIFVRNAFGNYMNILKEISYTDIMSMWLTYYGNMSLQYNLDNNKGETYPDENYAREIMQLFSVGLWQLNMDGSKKLDDDGNPLHAYDSNDIMNMARAWTGFARVKHHRGNAESQYWGPHVDIMQIEKDYRDIYPKRDILGGYIGDRFPLCADLPVQDHLSKGATYRLLGGKINPEMQQDGKNWEDDDNLLRLELQASSPLYEKLCAPNNGVCTFPGKVVLDENLLYESHKEKGGEEYNVETIRTLRIAFGSKFVHYEYIRPACVEQAFLGSQAKRVIRGNIGSNFVIQESVCADPKRDIATELCCNLEWDKSIKEADQWASRSCIYHAERMSYESAIDRCAAIGMSQCTPRRYIQSTCHTGIRENMWYSWTALGCKTQVKMSFETGLIGRVDYPEPDYAGYRNVAKVVSAETKNYFKVVWLNEPNLPTTALSCGAIETCYSVADGCICDTSVTEKSVFGSASHILSVHHVLSALHIGTFSPDHFLPDEIKSIGSCGVEGVNFFSRSFADSCSNLGTDAFLGVIDSHGVQHYLKNVLSTVKITGVGAFRNAPHFISFVDQDLRDMYYETDAVINHLFHHPSHAPFLASRIIQRFGISNPSPGYIERVATSYINGEYNGIGSGSYGDLGAMVAAVLLDKEARATTLDADPSHGQLREPLIKLTSFLRSMEAHYDSPLGWTKFWNLEIGQDPYGAPSVFSFFLPEYAPAGALEKANLVAPESEVLTGKQVTTLLNGFFSTVKFGLVSCHDGFGDTVNTGGCPTIDGDTGSAIGKLTYSAGNGATVEDVIDDLSLLLTAGRLGVTNRGIIKGAIENEYNNGDRSKAIRVAQQLVLSTPEFHSWGGLHNNDGVPRKIEGYSQAAKSPYKAVVVFYMGGGVDSFNLIVPKGDCPTKDMYSEYKKARIGHAIAKDDLLDIDATGSGQLCNTWGINRHFPILQELYNQGEASFILNMGILSKPLTKHDDWVTQSKIRLFAHNQMMKEQFALDPHDVNSGTGVGGRMLDILKRNGHQTSGNTVDGSVLLNIGDSYYSNPVTTIATGDVKILDEFSSLGPNEMLNLVKQLNGGGKKGNSMLGETWSERLSASLFEYQTSLDIDEAIKSGVFSMSGYGKADKKPASELRAAAQYMKSRSLRKVDREVFLVRQEGYDMHGGQSQLPGLFNEANDALSAFIAELKKQGIWENTVILMASDFGRSVAPNSNGGTDHAWGGNYFMLGGGIKGGKLMGKYPEHLSEKSDYWVRRGRMIPTTPYDSVWNGIAEWMGVKGDKDLGFVLPNRINFDKCYSMFRAFDMFKNVPYSPCIDDSDGDGVPDNQDECDDTSYWIDGEIDSVGCQAPTTSPPTKAPRPSPYPTPPPSFNAMRFEAEDAANIVFDGSFSDSNKGYTGSGYINMGARDSYVEWPSISSGTGGPCFLDFRYAVPTSSNTRNSDVAINGVVVGSLMMAPTGDSWADYGNAILETTCPSGTMSVRLTAATSNGGPNLDNLGVSIIKSPTLAPTKLTEAPGTSTPTKAPIPIFTETPTITSTVPPGQYEAEDAENTIFDGSISSSNVGYSGTGYVNMGRENSYVEWPAIKGGSGGPCTIDFRYSVKSSASSPRECSVTINDVVVGSLSFDATGSSWDDYGHDSLQTICSSGLMKIRVTAVSGNGGPNLDNLSIQPSGPPQPSGVVPTFDPTPVPSPDPTLGLTLVPTMGPTLGLNPPNLSNQPSVRSWPSGSVPILAPSQGPTQEPTTLPTPGPTLVLTPVPTPPPTPSPTKPPISTNSQPVAVNNVIQNGAVTFEYVSGTVSGCSEAVDGTTNVCSILRTKFEQKSLVGIVVTPPTLSRSIVKKLRVYNSNNSDNWDPKSYKISGRNSESEPWHVISEGATGSVKGRNNVLGVVINATFELGDPLLNFVEVAITNNEEYWQYQIIFPTIKDNSARWMSFGEVELPGYVVQPGDVITT